MNSSKQMDMFGTPKPENGFPLVVLELKGIGTIPSFKNNKMIIPPSSKQIQMALDMGDLKAAKAALKAFRGKRPLMITKPEYQAVMNRMISSIASQLRSAFRTAAGPTCPESSIRSWIASYVPQDDCWTKIPDIVIKGELCAPGEEGATITIQRL